MRSGRRNADCTDQNAGKPVGRSAIGYWLFTSLLLPSLAFGQPTGEAATASSPGPNEIPPLRPAKPEIVPGFWEEHSTWLVLAGLVVVGVVILAVRIGLRPKPEIPIPPATEARQALDSLSSTSNHATLLADVSAILRRYFIARFELGREQLTNTELSTSVREHPKIAPDLADRAVALLQDMEQRRFGSAPNTVERTAVQSAVELIDRTEECLTPPAAAPPSNRPGA